MSAAIGEIQVLPHNDEFERHLIGCAFNAPLGEGGRVVRMISERVREDTFYRVAHRKLWGTVVEMVEADEPLDVVALKRRLQLAGEWDGPSGRAFIATMQDETPMSFRWEYYLGVVHEVADRRALVAAATKLWVGSTGAGEDVSGLIEEASVAIKRVADGAQGGAASATLAEAIAQYADHLQGVYAGTESNTVRFGLSKLDEKTGGMGKGNLVLLGARPSVGKSALALNIARRVAVARHGVAFFSLEMNLNSITSRLIAAEGRMNMWLVENGRAHDQDWVTLQVAAEKIQALPIHIIDKAGLSLQDVTTTARQLQATHGIELVIVDYLQIMKCADAENRQQEISELSRGLKALARDMNIPILALTQLTRESEKGDGGRPQLVHLRESGSLEQDADTVLLLWRDLKKANEGTDFTVEVIIAKQRNGPIGVAHVFFDPTEQRFDNLEAEV